MVLLETLNKGAGNCGDTAHLMICSGQSSGNTQAKIRTWIHWHIYHFKQADNGHGCVFAQFYINGRMV
jgi:hypothetical protein